MNNQKTVETILADLGQKIDQLIASTKKAGNKVTDETEKKIEELKARKEKLEEEIKARSVHPRAKWTRAKTHFSKALKNLGEGIAELIKKG